MQKDKQQTYASYLILVAYGVVIFLFSYFNVWQGDDLNYRMMCTVESSSAQFDGDRIPVQSLSDILISQYHHYFFVNGRSVAHFLVQLFCGLLGHFWFAIFNSVAYIVLLAGVLRLSKTSITNTRALISAILLMSLGLATAFGPSCQIGYFWMFALNAWFLLIFFSSKRYSVFQMCALTPFSFIAGWSQEVIVVGIAGALGIYWLRNYRKFTARQYILAGAYIIGALFLCLSPGSIHRATGEKMSAAIYAINGISFLKIFYVMIAVCIFKHIRRSESIKNIYCKNAFLFNAIFILLLFNIILGIGFPRQILGIELLSAIILLRILSGHTLSPAWTVVAAIIVMSQFGIQANNTVNSYRTYTKLIRDYENSEDGTVYLDISNHGLLSDFLIIESYNVRLGDLLKFEYPISRLRNEIRYRYGKGKDISVVPMALKEVESDSVSSSAMYIGDGDWLLISADEQPMDFTICRSLSVSAVSVPWAPTELKLDSAAFHGHTWRAEVFGESNMCHIKIDSVVMNSSKRSSQL